MTSDFSLANGHFVPLASSCDWLFPTPILEPRVVDVQVVGGRGSVWRLCWDPVIKGPCNRSDFSPHLERPWMADTPLTASQLVTAEASVDLLSLTDEGARRSQWN